MYLSILNSFRVIRCLNQCVVQKLLFLPHFYFPWGRPWGNHTKCCMDKKRIWCSQIVSQHVPIYLQQCSSYSNRNCKKIAIFTYRSPHYYFPWRRPCDYHAICCMDGKTIQCLPKHLQRVPIYLTYPSLHFLFALGTTLWQSRKTLHEWKEFGACQTPRSMYLSIFNSFRVIRCLSQCISLKIAIFTTFFVFPGDAPWAITLNVVWMEREFDAYNCFAACAHLTITVSEIERDIGRKSSYFYTPLHSTPPLWAFPSE